MRPHDWLSFQSFPGARGIQSGGPDISVFAVETLVLHSATGNTYKRDPSPKHLTLNRLIPKASYGEKQLRSLQGDQHHQPKEELKTISMTQAANNSLPNVKHAARAAHAPPSTSNERQRVVKPSYLDTLADCHSWKWCPPPYHHSPDASYRPCPQALLRTKLAPRLHPSKPTLT